MSNMRGLRAVLAAALFAWAAGAQEFDVASVKPNKSDDPPHSNFPLGPGDVYVPNGGLFSATNFALVNYIYFAYKVLGNQSRYVLPQLPGWVTTDRFDIQARAAGNPAKDGMRMMMRSLLADRFHLATHYEDRKVPVLAWVLARPGKTGQQLQPHANDSACPTNAPPPSATASAQTPSPSQTVAGGFPALCNGVLGMAPSVPGRVRAGARNVTIAFIADAFSGAAGVGRPMVDQTGLAGTFDFTLEWTPEPGSPVAPEADFQPDPSGPSFEEALREQLGIKLQSQKGSVHVLVVDHVEHPSEN
jgi:uncharacterized protein (TIGR03435 family)